MSASRDPPGTMYVEHFSLSRLPFENVPDPAFFFDEGDRARVLQRMNECLEARRGLMIVAGPIGCGKTTLSQKLMSMLPAQTQAIWLAEPPENSADLLLYLLTALGGSAENTSRVFLLHDISDRLLKLHAEDRRCLVIMDESHKMSDDILEGLKLLNNLEQFGNKLIQVLLLGQDEFIARFSRSDFSAFKQRIAWLEHIGKMTLTQTREYVVHRLNVAGGHAQIFSAAAIEAIAAASSGVPRVINSLCDRSLSVACELGKDNVDLNIVRQAADPLGLGRELFFYLRRLQVDSQHDTIAPGPIIRTESSNAERSATNGRLETGRSGPPIPASSPCSVPSPEIGTAIEEASRYRPDANANLAAPLILFCFSILLFIASLWLYCERVGVDAGIG